MRGTERTGHGSPERHAHRRARGAVQVEACVPGGGGRDVTVKLILNNRNAHTARAPLHRTRLRTLPDSSRQGHSLTISSMCDACSHESWKSVQPEHVHVAPARRMRGDRGGRAGHLRIHNAQPPRAEPAHTSGRSVLEVDDAKEAERLDADEDEQEGQGQAIAATATQHKTSERVSE